ncbi:MAG: hypothetical protein AAF677_10945 [Pseudomonadota bacterium]
MPEQEMLQIPCSATTGSNTRHDYWTFNHILPEKYCYVWGWLLTAMLTARRADRAETHLRLLLPRVRLDGVTDENRAKVADTLGHAAMRLSFIGFYGPPQANRRRDPGARPEPQRPRNFPAALWSDLQTVRRMIERAAPHIRRDVSRVPFDAGVVDMEELHTVMKRFLRLVRWRYDFDPADWMYVEKAGGGGSVKGQFWYYFDDASLRDFPERLADTYRFRLSRLRKYLESPFPGCEITEHRRPLERRRREQHFALRTDDEAAQGWYLGGDPMAVLRDRRQIEAAGRDRFFVCMRDYSDTNDVYLERVATIRLTGSVVPRPEGTRPGALSGAMPG